MSRTVLIGLDGATFSILDPLMESGDMPFLKTFASRGARSELLSTPNPLTAAAWPAMTTGRSPGYTGVFDFAHFEERDGQPYFALTTSRDLCCETVWSIASRQKRTVTALNFFALWPPRPVAGYTISAFVSWRHLKDAVYPPELFERIKRLPRFNRKELSTDLDLERKCLQGLPPEEYEEWIAYHIRKEQQWFDILRDLMLTDPTDLTALVFEGVDKLQHLCWRFIDSGLFPETPSVWERSIRELCLDYFRQLDAFIGEIVALAGPDARVFIASDHGFGTSQEIFYVNAWLHEHGYLAWTDTAVVDTDENLTSEQLSQNVTQLDWSNTRAYAITSSSNGILIRVADGSGHGGILAHEYGAFRDRLIDELLAYTDPGDGRPVVTCVRTREEVYRGEHMRRAPDLLLTLRDGGFVSVLNADRPLKPRKAPAGTHRPEGIFMACGPGIRSGLRHAPLSILDVAPTLLYSLGLPIPADLEGALPTAIFDHGLLEAQPPCIGAATQPVTEPQEQDAPVLDGPAIEAGVVERLKALGYL